MRERNDGQGGTEVDERPDVDGVGRLLRAAGPRPDVPKDRYDRVRQTVHDRWREIVTTRRRRLFWIAVPAGAAVVAIVLLVSALPDEGEALPSVPLARLERSVGAVRWPNRVAPVPGAALDSDAEFETGADGRVALRLRGGASVRFDVDSRARLVAEDTLRLDRGTVYVDTGGVREPSVTIRADLGTVRDHGTRFQVRSVPGALHLSVREGAASVEHGGTSHAVPVGVRLALLDDGSVTSGRIAPADDDWSWIQDVTPAFDLEGRSLAAYLAWIFRETGLEISYADPAIAEAAPAITLHGSIADLRPDDTLEIVLPTCGLRYTILGSRILVARTN